MKQKLKCWDEWEYMEGQGFTCRKVRVCKEVEQPNEKGE